MKWAMGGLPHPPLRIEFGTIAGPSLEVGGGNSIEIITKLQLKATHSSNGLCPRVCLCSGVGWPFHDCVQALKP